MNQSDAAQSKAEIRRAILDARRNKEVGHFCEDAHDENLVLWLADNAHKKIAAYIALPDEPCTDLLLDVCEEVGIQVLVPRVVGDDLEWALFNWDDLVEGEFGVLEPTGPAEPLQVDAIIVPALAAAEDGTRLGRGKGFYDRALAGLPKDVPIIALVHEEELFDELPIEAHDIKVQWVSTCLGLHEVED